MKQNTKSIDILEKIIKKAYKQEMDSFIDIIKQIQSTKNPNIYYIYRQKYTDIIIIEKVELKPIKDRT